MLIARFMVVLFLLLSSACATRHALRVGDTRVIIEKTQHGVGKNFIHVHQNETTALRAAKAVVAQEGGSVMTLVHSGGRNIVFHLDKKRYEFDPNRIYTDEGIKKTLTQFGAYSRRAHAEVQAFANAIKSMLPKGKIIAVHNNNVYSIKEYLPGKSLHRDAQEVYLHPHRYYRNFYLVTRHAEFQRLKHLQFNTVLQGKTVTDDGSLSVYLENQDYVNVEAGYDELNAQIAMLKNS